MRNEVVYDYEIQEIIMQNLQYKYSIVNNKKIEFKEVFEIFLIRYFIYTDFKDKKIKFNIDKYLYDNILDVISFLKRELNIPKCLIYKDTEISDIYNESNSLINIMSSIIFEYGEKILVKVVDKLLSNIDMIVYLYFEIYKKNSNILKYPKKHQDYKYFLKFNMLLNVYEYYKSIPINIDYKINFIYYDDYYCFNNSIDEEILDIINKSTLNKVEKLVKEKEIEEYYKRNIHLLKEDLKIIKTQYKLKHGIIDILAKDSNDVIYIIEVKIKKDKRILWQIIYYYNSIKKIYKNNDVKFIIISPPLEDDIIYTLKETKIEFSLHNIDKKLLYK